MIILVDTIYLYILKVEICPHTKMLTMVNIFMMKKCIMQLCFFRLFVFFPGWLVGFEIINWRKTEKKQEVA